MGLPAGARLGPYEIVAPLGAGAMGEVYHARDIRLKRDVAVKVLPSTDPDLVRRFAQEAEAAGIPITVVEVLDKNLEALYEQPLALIRPDQHVAWRGLVWPKNEILSIVTGKLDQEIPAEVLSSAQ